MEKNCGKFLHQKPSPLINVTHYEVECSLDGLFGKKWLYSHPALRTTKATFTTEITVRVRKYTALPCLSGKKGGGQVPHCATPLATPLTCTLLSHFPGNVQLM